MRGDELKTLLEMSKKLLTNPDENAKQSVFTLLAQFAHDEQSREVRHVALPTHPSRNRSAQDTSYTFTTNDNNGDRISIYFEVESDTTESRLVGGMVTASKSTIWAEYTVVLYQDNIVQDFVEATLGNEFILQLNSSSQITLKLISTGHEVVMLENIEINIG